MDKHQLVTEAAHQGENAIKIKGSAKAALEWMERTYKTFCAEHKHNAAAYAFEQEKWEIAKARWIYEGRHGYSPIAPSKPRDTESVKLQLATMDYLRTQIRKRKTNDT